MAYIYKIENLLNKDFYIGKTTQTLEHRFSQHKSFAYHGGQTILANAIRKYGQENFIISIVEECDKSILNERETYYIQTLKPKYNIKQESEGATSTTWNKRKVEMYSLEGKFLLEFNSLLEAGEWIIQNRFSESKSAYVVSSHITDCCMERRKTAYSHQWRYKDNTKKILMNTTKTWQNIQKKVLMSYPDKRQKIFQSQSSCADYIIQNFLIDGNKKNISAGISKCCLNERKQYKGFRFSYID